MKYCLFITIMLSILFFIDMNQYLYTNKYNIRISGRDIHHAKILDGVVFTPLQIIQKNKTFFIKK